MGPMLKNKVIVITGPTATGKSALAVEIARKFGGEIISADSRQVYRGLDIGSAKITKQEMQGIVHHLIDVADVQDVFSVAEFQDMAREKMLCFFPRGLVPIIAGGTGMYISALIDNHRLPTVPPNPDLRNQLEQHSTTELFAILQTKDAFRAQTIDQNNRQRIIRAIEIAESLGSVPVLEKNVSDYDVLLIGLELPKPELVHRIQTRIEQRIPSLFDEINHLINTGITPERLKSFGLEYKYGTEYVQKLISLDEFKKTLATKTWQYAKRQMTWWKPDNRIIWMNPISDHQKILDQVKDFLNTPLRAT